jgi:hypothetical protein
LGLEPGGAVAGFGVTVHSPANEGEG